MADGSSISTVLLDANQKIILDRLPVAMGASFDSHAQEHNPTCLSNTRVELLRQISDWANDPGTESIFWLQGMAGTGKSTISRTVAQSFADKGHLGASFFFKRGEADRGSLAKFFTTIAADLVVRVPATAYYIMDVLDTDPSIIAKTVREQFDKLFKQPLSKITSNTRKNGSAVIVIDALDECEQDDDIKLAINLFSRAADVQPRRIKIFVTSRPELPLRLGFRQTEGKYQDFTLQAIPEPVIRHDISVYLEHELAIIREGYNASVPIDRQLPISWPGQSNVESLVKMAIPLFIFASTICRFISDRRCGSPNEQLNEVLLFRTRSQESQLDATYLPVLNRLILGLPSKQRDKVLQQFRTIVGSIVILGSPLPALTLGRILDVSKDIIDAQMDMLHSVLSIPISAKDPLKLLHLSFRDFLLDREKQGENPFWIDEKRAHAEMALNCLHVMRALKSNICDIQEPGTPRLTIETQKVDTCISQEIQYACLYWVYHVKHANICVADGGDINEFLTSHFLHWMEVLTLIGRASESPGLIKLLQSLLKVGQMRHITDYTRTHGMTI